MEEESGFKMYFRDGLGSMCELIELEEKRKKEDDRGSTATWL